MKKLLSLVLAIAMLLTVSAYAAEIFPLEGMVVTGVPEGFLPVSFTLDDFEEDGCLYIVLYEEQLYDTVDLNRLVVGDTIHYMDEQITVESIDKEDGIVINGGAESENGVTLRSNEGGTYIAVCDEFPVYMQIAACSVAFADEVTYSHWMEDEDGGIMSEMDVQVVPAAEIKDAIIASGEIELHPLNARVTLEDGKITELTVFYMP